MGRRVGTETLMKCKIGTSPAKIKEAPANEVKNTRESPIFYEVSACNLRKVSD